jgi:hypothetical protein
MEQFQKTAVGGGANEKLQGLTSAAAVFQLLGQHAPGVAGKGFAAIGDSFNPLSEDLDIEALFDKDKRKLNKGKRQAMESGDKESLLKALLGAL